MFPQASTLPEYDVFATAPGAAAPPVPGAGFVPEPYRHMTGLGTLTVSTMPVYELASRLSGRRPMQGMGQVSVSGATALSVGWLVLGTVAAGYLSYQAGKAMAPGGSSKKKWGWIGVPAGLFGGPIGLGIMGIVSNRRD